jgi:hypothetical protein
MNKNSLHASFVAVPLMIASVILPAGLDNPIDPLVAAVLPLAWAAAVAVFTGSGTWNMAILAIAALPFSAYTAAAYGTRPALPTCIALAAAAVSAIAARGVLHDRGSKWVPVLISLVIGAGPGLLLLAASTATSSIAVSVLMASGAWYLAARRRS